MSLTRPSGGAGSAVRHRLAPGALAGGILEATESLIALHATDPATVFLAARARTRDPDLAAMQAALYDERTVLRMLAMRRTVFVVSRASLPVVRAASTDAVAAQQRRRFVGLLEQAGIAEDGAAWVREVEDATVAALAARGEAGALAAELADDVPRLREPVPVGSGRWARPPAGVLLRDPPARGLRPHRARPPARVVDEHPVPLRDRARAGSARRCRRRSPRPRAPSSRAAGSPPSAPLRPPTCAGGRAGASPS